MARRSRADLAHARRLPGAIECRLVPHTRTWTPRLGPDLSPDHAAVPDAQVNSELEVLVLTCALSDMQQESRDLGRAASAVRHRGVDVWRAFERS